MSKINYGEPIKFIDWDYDTLIVTEYERVGECNQCGDCCKTRINIQLVGGDKNAHVGTTTDEQAGTTTDEQGRWSEIGYSDNDNERQFVRFYMPDEPVLCSCSAQADNLCTLNGEKPWGCRVWPTAPSDITQFVNCSYKFVEIGRWGFGESEYEPVRVDNE